MSTASENCNPATAVNSLSRSETAKSYPAAAAIATYCEPSIVQDGKGLGPLSRFPVRVSYNKACQVRRSLSLLEAQCFNRIEAGRFSCRIIAEGDSNRG